MMPTSLNMGGLEPETSHKDKQPDVIAPQDPWHIYSLLNLHIQSKEQYILIYYFNGEFN